MNIVGLIDNEWEDSQRVRVKMTAIYIQVNSLTYVLSHPVTVRRTSEVGKDKAVTNGQQ